ncbi:MAG: CHAT domain-containing protein [Elusimicrobia bacterium]|nr:CHAT domain-containing protein [Elusimicrobiota bacterium]
MFRLPAWLSLLLASSLALLLGVARLQASTSADDVRLDLKLAQLGDADAQADLARRYRAGDGVEKDEKAALEWLRKAALQGHPASQYNLGLAYDQGLGTPVDFGEARRWLAAAAEQAHDVSGLARFNLGVMALKGEGGRPDPAEALRWFEAAAERGRGEAMRYLAAMRSGEFGQTRDLREAFRWSKAAAETGDPAAQHDLAARYVNGDGTKKDLIEACTWLLLAAGQGQADARAAVNAVCAKLTPRQLRKAEGRAAKAVQGPLLRKARALLDEIRRRQEIHRTQHSEYAASLPALASTGLDLRAFEEELQAVFGASVTLRADESSYAVEAVAQDVDRTRFKLAGRAGSKESLTTLLEIIDPKLSSATARGKSLDELSREVESLISKDRIEDALIVSKVALSLALRLKDRKYAGYFANDLGALHNMRGHTAWALIYLNAAVELAVELKDAHEEAQALVNLGNAFIELGILPKAAEGYRRALHIRRKSGDRRGQASCLHNLGELYRNLGELGKARDSFQEAIALGIEVSGPDRLAGSLASLGTIHIQLGDLESADKAFSDAVRLASSDGVAQRTHAKVLNRLGELTALQGNYDTSIKAYLESARIARELGLRDETNELAIGAVYLLKGEFAKARAIFEKHGGDRWIGMSLLASGKPAQARDRFERCLATIRSRAERLSMADWAASSRLPCALGLAVAYERLKEPERARPAYEDAVGALEHMRDRLPLAVRGKFLSGSEGLIPIIEAYKGRARAATDADEAFFWSESAKARVFVEALAGRLAEGGGGLPKPSAEREARLAAEVVSLSRQIDAALERRLSSRRLQLEATLAEVRKEQEELVALLRKEHPAYAAVHYPQPLRAAEVALEPDEVLLQFDVSEDQGSLYVLRAGRPARRLVLKAGRGLLRGLVEAFREPFEDPLDSRGRFANRFDEKAGAALYRRLIQPARRFLPKGSRLIIVPDGVLGLLPFEALVAQPKKAGRARRYLADDFDVSYAQSGTALTLARRFGQGAGRSKGMFVLADPVFGDADPRFERDGKAPAPLALVAKSIVRRMGGGEESSFPRLVETAALAKALEALSPGGTKMLLGTRANAAALRAEDLSRYRYLVFATHGILDTDVPHIREPALVLAQPRASAPGEGFLTMSQVMGLKLDAEVAALTACQTGLGKEVSGEGVLGLGRAFQYAGARNVLVSLWSVAEKSSTMLAETFFAELKGGKNPREALRAARAAVRKQGYDHPFFWAPFILIGV